MISEINQQPGNLFLWIEQPGQQSANDQLYKGTIKEVINSDVENQAPFNPIETRLFINTNNVTLEVIVKKLVLVSVKENELKLLYARSNFNKVGICCYSFFHTFRKKNFKYARPVLANEVMTSELVPYILKDYYIIPGDLSVTDDDYTIYGVVIEEDEGYVITLTNNRMIEFDNQYIDGTSDDINKIYRPYFYEFFVDDKTMSQLKSKQGDIYKVALSFPNDKDKVSINSNLIPGEILFSASPPIQIPAYLEFLTKPDSKLAKQIDRTSKKLRSNIVLNNTPTEISNHFFKDISKQKLFPLIFTIYDVGQGNWMKIGLSPNGSDVLFEIAFDIGRSRRTGFNKEYNENAKMAANELKANAMFVLSHWDLDHIQGLPYLTNQQLETRWIVPQLPNGKISNSALRLAAYLHCNKSVQSLFISESLNGQVIFDQKNFKLGKGFGGKKQNKFKLHYSKANNIGLVLAIQDPKTNKQILLPGDCEYLQLPPSFLQEYNLMVISHHGAKTTIKNIGFPPSTYDKKAIATVDAKVLYLAQKNSSKNTVYPKQCHVSELGKLGYDISTTENKMCQTFELKDL